MKTVDETKRHVGVDGDLAKVVGKPDAGTRIYRAEGDDEAYMLWWDRLCSYFPRGLVSPGGACPYAGVSRAAVHRAMREGRLTVFAFHPIKEQRGIFGSRVERSSPYVYLPVVELKAWRMELEERIGRQRAEGATLAKIERQLQEELEGKKPDWDAWFLLEHPAGKIVKRK